MNHQFMLGHVYMFFDVTLGLDIDYCKAISAAIFDGNVVNIEYKEVTTETRFKELAAGNVDVLLGNTSPTIQNDVKEATSGVGFSFSQPYFYAGLTMGGVPPYVFHSASSSL
jgi:ABC-type amino acid transport substrate-binding protein